MIPVKINVAGIPTAAPNRIKINKDINA